MELINIIKQYLDKPLPATVQPGQAMDVTDRDKTIIQAYQQVFAISAITNLPVFYYDKDVFIPPVTQWGEYIH